MRLLLALLSRICLLLAIVGGVYGTVVIGFKIPIVGWCVLGALVWQRYRSYQRRAGGHAYGTARVANAMDLYVNGLLGRDGLILGRTGYTAGPTFGEALRYLLTLPLAQSEAAVALVLGTFSVSKWGRDSIIRVRDFVHLVTFAPTAVARASMPLCRIC